MVYGLSTRRMINVRFRGFTLVELLVTIAVVSVLMAILLPAMHRVRVLGKRVNCQSNLRQIAQAWRLYLDDNQGRFFQGLNADVAFVGWRGYYIPNEQRPLNRYLSVQAQPESEDLARVARCPADDGKTERTGLPVYKTHGSSYRANHLMIGPDQISPLPSQELTAAINKRLKGLKVSQTDNPSRLILMGNYGWVDQWWPTVPEITGWHGRRHHFNVSFLDGHVGFLKIHKGIYVDDEYVVLPFDELYGLAREAQEEKQDD